MWAIKKSLIFLGKSSVNRPISNRTIAQEKSLALEINHTAPEGFVGSSKYTKFKPYVLGLGKVGPKWTTCTVGCFGPITTTRDHNVTYIY